MTFCWWRQTVRTRLVLRTATSEILRSNKDSTKRMSRRDKPIPSLELTYPHPRYVWVDAFPFSQGGICIRSLEDKPSTLMNCPFPSRSQMLQAELIPDEISQPLRGCPGRFLVDGWITVEENQGFSFGGIFILKILQKMQAIWTMCQVGWLNHHIDWLRTGKWFPLTFARWNLTRNRPSI